MTVHSKSLSTFTAFALLLLTGLLTPVAGSAEDPPPSTSPEIFLIGIGDVLQVSVWKNEELTVTVPVRPDGRISLPLVGEVEVAGRTPEVLRSLLITSYEEYVTSPAVSVVVEQINSRRIFVMGEVRAAGAYDIIQPTRLLQALAMAGGFTEFAKKGQVVVLRDVDGGEQRMVISIKDIQSGASLDGNLRLRPGDTIIVP